MLFRPALDALRFQAAVIDPRLVAVALKVQVLHIRPALARGLQAFFRSGAVLATAALLWCFGVVSLEVLGGVTV